MGSLFWVLLQYQYRIEEFSQQFELEPSCVDQYFRIQHSNCIFPASSMQFMISKYERQKTRQS